MGGSVMSEHKLNTTLNDRATKPECEHSAPERSTPERSTAEHTAPERSTHQPPHDLVHGNYGRAAKPQEAQYIDPQGHYYKPWVASYPQSVPEFVDTHPFENLVELLDHSVAQYGAQTAFVNMGSELTYAELGALSEAFAAFLQLELGLRPGDKFALMMPNLMQFPVAFFGALKAGLTVTNVNPLYTPRELKNQLDNSDAKAIVVIANYAHHLAEIVADTKIESVIITEVGDELKGYFGLKRIVVNSVVKKRGLVPEIDLSVFKRSFTWMQALKRGKALLSGAEGGTSGSFVRPQVAYDDIALLQYTGGTTGRSKGAMISHGNIIANIAQALGMYRPVLTLGGECILTVIPLYHIFALTVNFILFVHIGGKNLLITDPRDLKSFAKDLERHPEVTALTGVNTLFNLFNSHDDFSKVKWEHLHLVIGGGAAVQSGVEQRFFAKTGFHILEGYGLTECSPLCSVCPFDVDHYTGSIGLIVPSTIARIVDADGNEIHDLEHEGELEIKGPQVMHGYYKNPEQNDIIFDDGYVRTGDIAKWMEGGYIKLIDRLKDMILVSGFNVFPNEIEDVVSRFDRVLECAVIGVPDEKTGEAVKLFVVKKDPTLTAAEIKHYCRAYLTPYKVPHLIQFVDSLPKSSLGKVLRRKLRALEQLQNPMAAAAQRATKAINALQDEVQGAEHLAEQDATMHAAQQEGVRAAQREVHQLDHAQQIVTNADAHDKHAVGSMYTSNLASTAATAFDDEVAKDASPDHAMVAAQKAEDAAEAVPEIKLPPKKSVGALALEQLLSSQAEGLGAATETPNIHRQLAKSQLVRSKDDSRLHLGPKRGREHND